MVLLKVDVQPDQALLGVVLVYRITQFEQGDKDSCFEPQDTVH
jgi:hypothetical protein